MKDILEMLRDLNVDGVNIYDEEFEQPFLSLTTDFYREESQTFLSQNSCADYLRKVQSRISEEADRASSYLAASTEPKVKFALESELITKHAKMLVEMENSGCEYMLNEGKDDDLALLYSLLGKVPSTLDVLRDFVFEHVRQLGMKIVVDQVRHALGV